MTEVSIHIEASPEVIWRVLVDVEHWPEWTASVTSVELLDGGELSVGSTVRIKQPKMPSMVWRVTELDPLRSFTWTATSGGVAVDANHVITQSAGGGADVRLTTAERGLLAPLVRFLAGRRGKRYMEMEAQGLKRRSES
jgi:uncharacterized protein YndB with AHSA1/START domain